MPRPYKRRKLTRTHCKRGHEMTSKNTYLRKDGYPECATCSKLRVERQREREQLKRLRRHPVNS